MLTRRQFGVAGGALLLSAGTGISFAWSIRGAEAAAARLTMAGIYAFGGIGFANIIGQSEKDYDEVLGAGPDRAVPLFESVFARGLPAAKCYALSGLYQLKRERVAGLVKTIADSKEKVSTAHGCIIDEAPLGELAREIARTGFA